MLSYVLAVGLAIVALLAIVLRKVYNVLPSKELKRRAEMGDLVPVRLWPAVAYGASLRTFLWLVIAFSGALCFVLLSRVAPPLLGFVAVALLLWLGFAWLPAKDSGGLAIRLTYILSPFVASIVGTLQPVLSTIHGLVHRRNDGHLHTGVYVRDDLISLIERQKSQEDNDLTIEELDLAARALQFGDKKVRDCMVPRKKVRTVDASDPVSPVYLDELHQTGYGRFPVSEGKPENFVGTLYLRDLTDVGSGKGARGAVRSHMSPGVVYVHEADSLADSLHAFYTTKKSLFVVINKFEEYVGIITLEDILHALLGVPSDYDFDQHDDRSAVAAKHNKKPKHVDHVIDETASETDQPLATSDITVDPAATSE